MKAGPPRLWRRLLERLLPPAVRDDIVHDLDRLWAERREAEGGRAAGRWYRGQVLKAVRASLPAVAAAIARSVGTAGALAALARDVRHALRQLARHPGVGAVAVLTLALGIGSTTAVFSAVHAVLLKPLPYDRPSELVMVTSRVGGSSLPRHVSGPDAMEMAEEVPSVAAVAGFGEATVGPLTRVDRPEHVLTAPLTWNVFEVLGVDVALGRNFVPEDGVPASDEADGSPPPPTSALISHDFWVRSFGADPGVIGRSVDIWGGATTIVGVLPEGFRLVVPPELNIPPDADVWMAIRRDVRDWPREGRWLRTVARLGPGASMRDAQREVDAFADRLRRTHPLHAAEETTFRVTSLQKAAAAPMEGPLLVLMAAVVLVLLVACANVANLLLARGAARADEMAVRSWLGAGKGRLIRQLVAESAVLAFLGALAGVLLAWGGVALLHRARPPEMHRLEAVGLDLPVLAFAVVATAAATLAAGVLPAVQTARAGAPGRLRSRGVAGVSRRARSALVVVEVAFSIVLLVGAGLLIRTFAELERVPLGFEPEGVLTATVTQPIRPSEERRAYEAELLRSVRSVPGVESAGIVFPLPMNGVYERTAEYALDGREDDPAAWTMVWYRTVSPSYFGAMGLEMKRGRPFSRADESHDLPVVILDERMAARAFPGRDPVGGHVRLRGIGADTLRAEVVGVVEYAPQWDHRDARATVYLPRTFYRSHEVSLVARVEGDPAALAPHISSAVRGVDPTLPARFVPMRELVGERLARARFLSVLMQVFGALALGLTAVGLYGVVAYSVRLRTRELGLRAALGAEGAELVGGVVIGGMRLAAAGLALGALGALLAGRAMGSVLFRVDPADPWVMAAAGGTVLLVAFAASLVPALRAARVDPVTALRAD